MTSFVTFGYQLDENVVTSDGDLTNRNLNSVTITNKPPPAPRNAQYNSGS